jgi:glucose dehydrogenase
MKLSMQIADLNRFAVALIGLSLALGAPSSAAQENGSWPMPGENLAGFRYSELDQINADNVGQLAVAWTFYNTLDGQTIGLDAETGEELWRTALGDINIGETITMAPLVIRDKVLVGNSGGEYGVRGWIAALDANDGSLAWQAYNTGPDRDVLIGERFKPFYPQDRGEDLGVASWPPDAWRIGGGTVWGWLSYDPEANLLYHAPPIQARGTPSSGRATISGPPASSHAFPIPAKPSGSTSGRRTICTTTTGSTRMS